MSAKMNIAVFDTIDLGLPGGALTWSYTVIQALRDLGHHVGRFRYDKFRSNPEILKLPFESKDAGLMMSGYDFILINDPAYFSEDAWARNKMREPRYLELLDHVKKPVVAMLHSRLSNYSGHIRIRDILAHPNVTHLMMSDRRDLEEFSVSKPVHEEPYLPYLPAEDGIISALAERPLRRGAFMSARLGRSKNQLPLFLIAANDFIDLDVEFFGTSFLGAPVTIPQSHWKRCVQQWGCKPIDPLSGPFKMDPWVVQSPGGNEIAYRGPYSNINAMFLQARCRAHVNLTLERNQLEYASIEAMAAGHPIVVNSLMIADRGYDMGSIIAADGVNYGEISRAILEANDLSDDLVRKSADENIKLHDAHEYVKRMIDFVNA